MGEPQQGTWNTPDWQIPVELGLFNNVNSTDAHTQLMFSGGHMLPPHFRQRFQSPIHLPGHHLSTLSISTHPMIENNHQVSVNPTNEHTVNTVESENTAQDTHVHPIGQNLNLATGEGMEETDEASDEDEEEDDDDEELEDGEVPLHENHQQSQQQPQSGLSMTHPIVDEPSLPSCQHSQQQNSGLQSSGEHQTDAMHPPSIMATVEDPCHRKNNLIRTDSNGMHAHPHVQQGMTSLPIPTHSLHPHPLATGVNPMLPPNPLMMGPVVQTPSEGPYSSEANSGPPPPPQNNSDCDPDSGFSVYGKMYFEGRVVLHLKQWTETNNGGMHLPSCAQQTTQQSQPKSQFQGCALCRLKNQQDGYRGQKEAHRHSVKGVLFTFEDCIIVELYQDQTPSFGYNHLNDPKPRPEQRKTPQTPMTIPLTSYMIPGTCGHNPNVQLLPEKRMMDPMDMVNLIGPEKQTSDPNSAPPPAPVPPVAPVAHQESTRAWWDDFDSERDGPGTNSNDSTGDRVSKVVSPSQPASSSSATSSSTSTSSLTTMKPTASDPLAANSSNGLAVLENLHHHQQPESQSPDEYKFKWKCDNCSLSFVSQMHLESHNCAATGSPKNNTTPSLEMDLDSPPNNEEVDESVRKDNNSSSNIGGPSREESMVTPSPTCSPGNLNFEESKDKECSSVSGDSPSDHHHHNVGWMYSCPVSGCSKSFQLKKMLKQHQEQCQQNAMNNSLESSNDFSFGQDKQCSEAENENNGDDKSEQHSNESNDLDCNNSTNGDSPEPDENNKRKVIRWPRKMSKFHNKRNNKMSTMDSLKTKAVMITKSPKTKKLLHIFQNESEEDNRSEDADSSDEKKEELINVKTKETTKPAKKSSRRFQCQVCHKKFTLERRLERHKAAHKCDNSSQCEKCGKKFARKDKLIRHMFVHNEEKMFVCEICEKRFSRRDKLADHLKSHGTEEVHNCPLCQKQFLRPDILKQHVKLHGMGNKHQCPECLRFVTGKDRLDKHMARHEEAKALGQTLLCPLCTKYFIQRQSLKAHIKKFHPDAIKHLEPDNEDSCSATKNSGDEKPTVVNNSNPSANNTDSSSSGFPEKNNSQVCLLLEDVMGTSKTVCTKPRPFSCQICKKDFVRKQALKKHMRKHNQSDYCVLSPSKIHEMKKSSVSPSKSEVNLSSSSVKKKKRHKKEHSKAENNKARFENGTNEVATSVVSSRINSTEIVEPASERSQIVVPSSSSPPQMSSELSVPRDVNISTLASTAGSTTFMGVTQLAMTSHHHVALAAAAAHVQQQNACATISSSHYLPHQHLHQGHPHGTHALITGQETVVSATNGHLTPTCVTQISQLSTASLPVHQHINGASQAMCAPSSYVLAYPQYTYQ